ncbi:NAD(P)/FAD-dependent oxidoreductase [Streptomyces melanosporofaciens]
MDSSAIMGCVDRIECLRSAIEHRLTHRKEFAGFGASGRNGGWLSAGPPGQMRRYAKAHGRESAIALQREMFSSVDEVIRVAAEEGIEADIQKDGLLHVATNAAQERRLRDRLPSLRAEGWGEDDLIELDRDQLAERVRVAGAHGAQWSPHCARIQPAKLVRGLAAVVERMGVAVYEGTEVTEIRPRQAATEGVALDHTWSGVLGVPRDWCATVHLNERTGLGWAGGYVGHGVTTSNLAGRTLRDLILGQKTDLTRLPWVDRTVRGWEPEPLRWLGVRSLYVASLADASSASLPPATLDELIKQAMKSAGSRASPSARAAR